MAQWVKTVAIKSDDLGVISGTHMVKRSKSQTLSSDLHAYTMAHTHTPTPHTNN